MELTVSASDFATLSTDTLIIGQWQLESPESKIEPTVSQLNQLTDKLLNQHLTEQSFTGEFLSTSVLHRPANLAVKSIIIVGLGQPQQFSEPRLRQVAAKATQVAQSLKVKTVVTGLTSQLPSIAPAIASQMITEGILLGNYQFTRYKTSKAAQTKQSTITQVCLNETNTEHHQAIEQGVLKGEAIATAVLNTRDIINEPPSKIKPSHLAKAAQEIASLSKNITATILDEGALKKERYNALLAVAAGSEEKPYLIHLHYKPLGARQTVALVGKGVTFDSGGLGIKPWSAMLNMKADMAGGATVLGIFQALAELEALNMPIPVEVHGVVAATENMISGKAMRPDDIIETRSGKTIEVLHTDAEGRLILADALTYAVEQKPDIILDFATLTGAAIRALGLEYAAVMGNHRAVLDQIEQASRESGEPLWELPLPDSYKKHLESSVADLQNITTNDSSPGAIFGGLFLQEFVNDIPWAHLDIAGPSFLKEDINPIYPKGATGYGILLGLRFLELVKQ